jgi:hypothetical protein
VKYIHKKTEENAFMNIRKLVFYFKNVFHSLLNMFFNEKNLSESRRMHSWPFYSIMEWFLPCKGEKRDFRSAHFSRTSKIFEEDV